MDEVQKSHFLIYQSEDGKVKLDVRFENETVWLTQAMIVELFQSSKANVSEHISHIFEEGELDKDSVVRKFRTTAADGKNYDTTNGRQLLQDAGKISHELAMSKAEAEYILFDEARKQAQAKLPNDFDKFAAEIPIVRQKCRKSSKKSEAEQ